jgi:hypothetical protein
VQRGGAFGDHKAFADLPVSKPVHEQRRHLALARRQLQRAPGIGNRNVASVVRAADAVRSLAALVAFSMRSDG